MALKVADDIGWIVYISASFRSGDFRRCKTGQFRESIHGKGQMAPVFREVSLVRTLATASTGSRAVATPLWEQNGPFGPPADAAGAAPEEDPQEPIQTTQLITQPATNEKVDDAIAP